MATPLRLSAAAERHAATFARKVSAETRRATRAIIRQAIAEGLDVYGSARMIRAFAGMNGPQAMAALSYRSQLIESGLSADKVSAELDRYVGKKIEDRAHAIASYETRSALEEGRREAWKQAVEDGEIPETSERVWSVTDTACPAVCAEMEGQAATLDEPFTLPDGEEIMGPPAHAFCACSEELMVRRHRKAS